MKIDLNCDLGEGFGSYCSDDDRIIPLISSANIACGFHAGDPRTIDKTVRLCKQHHVAIGAHVSYPDLVGFGRRYMELSSDEIVTDVLYQIGALAAFCRINDVRLHHVKPHGALYNRAQTCKQTAHAIVQAIKRYDPDLLLYTQPGMALAETATTTGISMAGEGFCDRNYSSDGTLLPRSHADAIITDVEQACKQAVTLARSKSIATLCVHGDNPAALSFLNSITSALSSAHIFVSRPNTAS